VLILSANGDEASKVRGFRLGADDYLTTPFGMLELLARVDNLMRRSNARAAGAAVIRFGSVEVNPAERVVTRQRQSVYLRPKEYDLLLALVGRPGRVWSRSELLESVWGYDPSVVSRTVDWHVAELRRKLELDSGRPRFIHTVRKVGYRFDRVAV
jgi:DNA-binding response OmpR family regulator